MLGHHSSGFSKPQEPSYALFAQTYPSGEKESSGCSTCKCCTISFTATGFVMSLFGGLYCLFIQQSILYFPFFLVSAIICLFVLIYVITKDEPSTIRSTRSTITLPAYIVIQTEHAENVASSSASTESTLSADEGQDEEAAGSSKKKAGVKSLGREELGAATETVVKVVDETLYGKGGAEEAGEGSSELSAEARRVLKGVRQRRQSPTEPQKPVPSSEDVKTK